MKLFHRGQMVKAHPRQQPGRRVTDPADLPAEKTTYAMRDAASLAARVCLQDGDPGEAAVHLTQHLWRHCGWPARA